MVRFPDERLSVIVLANLNTVRPLGHDRFRIDGPRRSIDVSFRDLDDRGHPAAMDVRINDGDPSVYLRNQSTPAPAASYPGVYPGVYHSDELLVDYRVFVNGDDLFV